MNCCGIARGLHNTHSSQRKKVNRKVYMYIQCLLKSEFEKKNIVRNSIIDDNIKSTNIIKMPLLSSFLAYLVVYYYAYSPINYVFFYSIDTDRNLKLKFNVLYYHSQMFLTNNLNLAKRMLKLFLEIISAIAIQKKTQNCVNEIVFYA